MTNEDAAKKLYAWMRQRAYDQSLGDLPRVEMDHVQAALGANVPKDQVAPALGILQRENCVFPVGRCLWDEGLELWEVL